MAPRSRNEWRGRAAKRDLNPGPIARQFTLLRSAICISCTFSVSNLPINSCRQVHDITINLQSARLDAGLNDTSLGPTLGARWQNAKSRRSQFPSSFSDRLSSGVGPTFSSFTVLVSASQLKVRANPSTAFVAVN